MAALAFAGGALAQRLPAGPPAVAAWSLEAGAERVARLHLQLAQDVLPTRARRGLADAFRELDALARDTLARSPDAESREALRLYRLVLEDTRIATARPPTRELSGKVQERSEELAWAAARAARALQSNSLTAALPAPRAVAQVAVLSQRLARERLAARWDARAVAAAGGTREALASEVRDLRSSLAAEPEALGELQLAENQLQFLREAPPGRPSPKDAETVAKAADQALESLVRLSRRLAPGVPPR